MSLRVLKKCNRGCTVLVCVSYRKEADYTQMTACCVLQFIAVQDLQSARYPNSASFSNFMLKYMQLICNLSSSEKYIFCCRTKLEF